MMIYSVLQRPLDLAQFLISGVRVYGRMSHALTHTYPYAAPFWELCGVYMTSVPEAYVEWSDTHRHGILVRPAGGWKLITLDEEAIDVLESEMVEGRQKMPWGKDRAPEPLASVERYLEQYPTVADMRDALSRYRDYVEILRHRGLKTADATRRDKEQIKTLGDEVVHLTTIVERFKQGEELREQMAQLQAFNDAGTQRPTSSEGLKRAFEEHQKRVRALLHPMPPIPGSRGLKERDEY